MLHAVFDVRVETTNPELTQHRTFSTGSVVCPVPSCGCRTASCCMRNLHCRCTNGAHTHQTKTKKKTSLDTFEEESTSDSQRLNLVWADITLRLSIQRLLHGKASLLRSCFPIQNRAHAPLAPWQMYWPASSRRLCFEDGASGCRHEN